MSEQRYKVETRLKYGRDDDIISQMEAIAQAGERVKSLIIRQALREFFANHSGVDLVNICSRSPEPESVPVRPSTVERKDEDKKIEELSHEVKSEQAEAVEAAGTDDIEDKFNIFIERFK